MSVQGLTQMVCVQWRAIQCVLGSNDAPKVSSSIQSLSGLTVGVGFPLRSGQWGQPLPDNRHLLTQNPRAGKKFGAVPHNMDMTCASSLLMKCVVSAVLDNCPAGMVFLLLVIWTKYLSASVALGDYSRKTLSAFFIHVVQGTRHSVNVEGGQTVVQSPECWQQQTS